MTPSARENALLPWHREIWEAWHERVRAKRLPHALLLAGSPGLGKNRFVLTLTQALLCTAPAADGQACNRCRSCLLYQAGNHPDYLQVRPPEEDKTIAIDTIREVNAYLTLKSHYHGYKVVIISPAEKMNTAASNSLLKTLEEPAGQALLILVTKAAASLLPTIRSRCQMINFTRPLESQALAWLRTQITPPPNLEQLLEFAQGAPLTALQLCGSDNSARRLAYLEDMEKLCNMQADTVTVAAAWLQKDSNDPFTWLLHCTQDMIRLKWSTDPPCLANRDLQSRLRQFSEGFQLTSLYAHWDRINAVMRLAHGQVNLQMMLESLLTAWTETYKSIDNDFSV